MIWCLTYARKKESRVLPDSQVWVLCHSSGLHFRIHGFYCLLEIAVRIYNLFVIVVILIITVQAIAPVQMWNSIWHNYRKTYLLDLHPSPMDAWCSWNMCSGKAVCFPDVTMLEIVAQPLLVLHGWHTGDNRYCNQGHTGSKRMLGRGDQSRCGKKGVVKEDQARFNNISILSVLAPRLGLIHLHGSTDLHQLL